MTDVLIEQLPELLVVQDDDTAVLLIETAVQGPPGPQGPQGPNGDAEVYVAAANISGHVVATLNGAGEVVFADISLASHGNSIIGITTSAATAGGEIGIATSGVVSHSGWSFTAEQPVFVTTGGQVSQTPAVGVWLKAIGVAKSATSFQLSLQPAIYLT